MFDEKTLNIINPDKPKTIWDPKSEFMRELEIYKLKSEIKPRKVDMMRAQDSMMKDMVEERKIKQLYVPNRNGGFVK